MRGKQRLCLNLNCSQVSSKLLIFLCLFSSEIDSLKHSVYIIYTCIYITRNSNYFENNSKVKRSKKRGVGESRSFHFHIETMEKVIQNYFQIKLKRMESLSKLQLIFRKEIIVIFSLQEVQFQVCHEERRKGRIAGKKHANQSYVGDAFASANGMLIRRIHENRRIGKGSKLARVWKRKATRSVHFERIVHDRALPAAFQRFFALDNKDASQRRGSPREKYLYDLVQGQQVYNRYVCTTRFDWVASKTFDVDGMLCKYYVLFVG